MSVFCRALTGGGLTERSNLLLRFPKVGPGTVFIARRVIKLILDSRFLS